MITSSVRKIALALTITTVLTSPFRAKAQVEYSDALFREAIRKTEIARQNIDSVLTSKAIVFNKLENLSIQGRVSGSINGSMVSHSPLSMLAFGMIAGALAGGALVAPFTIPFLSVPGAALGGIAGGAGLGAAAGGIIAPGIPTGKGEINGTLSGSLDGKGYQILNTASVFGLVTLDRAVLQGLHQTVQANPNAPYQGCASTIMSMLARVSQDERTMNDDEIAAFMQNLKIYNSGVKTLRSMMPSVAHIPNLANQIESRATYFENWIRELRVSVISVAGFKPVYDIQKKVYVRESNSSSRSSKNLGTESGTFDEPASGGYSRSIRFWRKTPTYSEAEMKREFGEAAQYSQVLRSTVDQVVAVVPKVVDGKISVFDGSDIRYGEIIPARDSEKELSCTGNTTEEAIDFLLRSSRSFDFYLTHPGNPNFRARFN